VAFDLHEVSAGFFYAEFKLVNLSFVLCINAIATW